MMFGAAMFLPIQWFSENDGSKNNVETVLHEKWVEVWSVLTVKTFY